MPEREGRGWRTTDERPSDNDMPRTNVLSGKQVQTDVLSTKTGVDRHLYTHMVAELARRSHGDRAVKQSTRSRLVNRFEVEASRIIKKIAQRNRTITPEKINQVSWNETEYIKICRISTRPEIVDVSTAMQRNVTQNQTTQKESDKETQQVNLGWTSDTVNLHIDVL